MKLKHGITGARRLIRAGWSIRQILIAGYSLAAVSRAIKVQQGKILSHLSGQSLSRKKDANHVK